MTNPKIPVTEDELHAYVDHELPAERRGDVEAWLSAHPDDAARVRAWRTMAEALHARYDSVLDETVPKRLEIERLVRQPRQWFYGAAAAAVFQSLTLEALDAHRLYVVEVRHPVEVPGNERAHLQQWLTRRCGWTVRAPELDATGLKLVGGRLLPGPTGPASFLMYESASGCTPHARPPRRRRCGTRRAAMTARCSGPNAAWDMWSAAAATARA